MLFIKRTFCKFSCYFSVVFPMSNEMTKPSRKWQTLKPQKLDAVETSKIAIAK